MNRKLIFLDIDGTLLPPGDMLIPDSTLQALRAARANGHKLFLCTGRNLHMTAPLLEYGCFDGAICSAGGYVLCDGQVLVDLPMEPEQCSGLSAVLEQHGVDYTLESRDDTFAGPKMTARWKFTADAPDKPLNSEAARWRKAMQDGMRLTPLSRYDGQPIYKIVYIAEHLRDLDEAKRLYQDQFVFCESNLDTMDDGMVNGELINRKFDKGTGIRAICRHLGHPQEDTIGFGDSDDPGCRDQCVHGQRLGAAEAAVRPHRPHRVRGRPCKRVCSPGPDRMKNNSRQLLFAGTACCFAM